LEELENRITPAANITITNAFLVDVNNTPLAPPDNGGAAPLTSPTSPGTPETQTAAPDIGEQVFVQADFTTQNLPANASYRISFSVDGVTQESDYIDWGAGDTGPDSWNYYISGWYAAPGTHKVVVNVDPDQSVTESTYADNTTSFNFTPVSAPDLPQKFIYPIGGTPFQTWVDYSLSAPPYANGDHDFGMNGFASMDAGVPVLAAAGGTVVATADGAFDRRITGDGTDGNYVEIDNGHGWTEWYFHFRTNTILVHPGDTVVQGQVLGLVGSAGNSTGAHACFQVYHNEASVEPDFDPNTYWVTPLPVEHSFASLLASGVTTDDSALNADLSVEEKPVSANVLTQAAGQQLSVWVSGVWWDPTDVAYKFYAPNGTEDTALDYSFTSGDTFGGYWDHIIDIPAGLALGTWTVGVNLNGKEVARDPFQVTTTGAGTAHVTQGNTIVANGRTTPIDFGSAAPGDAPPQLDFTVANVGSNTLTVSNLSLPAGFSLVGSFPSAIAPGNNANFTVEMITGGPGTVAGVLSFSTTDPNAPTFRFEVKGTVTGGPTGAIHGQVFNDADGNGIETGAEVGLPGWTVTLLNPADNSVVATTTTSFNGFYQFYNLAPGTYRVRETVPFGWVQTTPIPADLTVGTDDVLAYPAGVRATFVPSGIVSVDPTSATWYFRGTPSPGVPNAGRFAFGGPGWVPLLGDWNGDGVKTVGSFDPATATWYLRNENGSGAPDAGVFRFGAPGWIPVVGDWTGTGEDGIGVVDPATGTWYLRSSATPGSPDVGVFRYGAAGWIPVVGDWTDSGRTGIGAVDPATETWYLRSSASSGAADVGTFRYGGPGWQPVTGDWGGSGKSGIGAIAPNGTWYLRDESSSGGADAGVFAYGAAGWTGLGDPAAPGSSRSGSPALGNPTTSAGSGSVPAVIASVDPATATWYLRSTASAGAPDAGAFVFGLPGWIPVLGDWDGHGVKTVGMFDPATATWYLRNENSPGAFDAGVFQFGAPGWIPIVGDWTGTGRDGIGVVDPTTGTWYLRSTASPGAADVGIFRFGAADWIPVVGDWTGSGHAEIGVVDPGFNIWYLRSSAGPGTPDVGVFQYGLPGWEPVTGDWSGSGKKTGIGAIDTAVGTWFLRDEPSAGSPDGGVFNYGGAGWTGL
jgi:hypothetical protein